MNTEHAAYERVQKLLAAEQDLPANCFSLRRRGEPEAGIVMSLDPGPDLKNPWEPHVAVGKYRVNRDKRHECVYLLAAGMQPILRRANAVPIVREGRQTFPVLRHPGFGELQCSLIKAFLGRPEYGKALTGMSGTASLIADNGEECMANLFDGQVVHFFFPDGAVRSFHQGGTQLLEEKISPLEALNLRISNAKQRLLSAKKITEEGRKRKVVRYLLSGMLGIIRQTNQHPYNGRILREVLLREFFFTLSKSKAEFVLPKLVEELSRIDKPLLAMLKHFRYLDEQNAEIGGVEQAG